MVVIVPVGSKWASFAGCTHSTEQEAVRERVGALDLQSPSLLISECLLGSNLTVLSAGALKENTGAADYVHPIQSSSTIPKGFQSQNPLCHAPGYAIPASKCLQKPSPQLSGL